MDSPAETGTDPSRVFSVVVVFNLVVPVREHTVVLVLANVAPAALLADARGELAALVALDAGAALGTTTAYRAGFSDEKSTMQAWFACSFRHRVASTTHLCRGEQICARKRPGRGVATTAAGTTRQTLHDGCPP